MDPEPLVTEEQGAVYLFSRYWEAITKIKKQINKLLKVGSRFPDCYYFNHYNQFGGLEFEHKLSGFRIHLVSKKSGGVKMFYNNPEFDIKANFLVVYWIEDDDEKDIIKQFQKLTNSKKIKFINLSKYFDPYIKSGKKSLEAYWRFSKNQRRIRNTKSILKDFNKLPKNSVTIFDFKDSQSIKIMGFNPKNAENVNYVHWGLINFYTTTSEIDKQKPPTFILFKPRGSNAVEAYIKVKKIFKIKNKNKQIESFFKKYYFWPYGNEYSKSTCIIYSQFKQIPLKDGKLIFSKIKRKKGWQSKGWVINAEKEKKLYNEIKRLLK